MTPHEIWTKSTNNTSCKASILELFSKPEESGLAFTKGVVLTQQLITFSQKIIRQNWSLVHFIFPHSSSSLHFIKKGAILACFLLCQSYWLFAHQVAIELRTPQLFFMIKCFWPFIDRFEETPLFTLTMENPQSSLDGLWHSVSVKRIVGCILCFGRYALTALKSQDFRLMERFLRFLP